MAARFALLFVASMADSSFINKVCNLSSGRALQFTHISIHLTIGNFMTKQIAQQWLDQSAGTANALNLAAHMNLISKRVVLTGVPGFEKIGYDDWHAQCEHEFSNKVLKRVHYQGLKLIVETDSRVMFKTYETVEGVDGTINAQGVEMLLEKEADGVWRLIQERVLPAEETAHDKLI